MEEESVETLKQRVYFLERTIFEITGWKTKEYEVAGKKFDSLESLIKYLSDRTKEYAKKYW